MNLNFSDLWLLHLEIMLLSVARGRRVPTWALKKRNHNTPHTAALTVSPVALWSLRADQ